MTTDPGKTGETAPHCFIVEDNPAVARFTARCLLALGVVATHFTNVAALIDGLKVQHPRLIFLDISLGDSDAVDAIRALSAAGYTGSVQLMSGSNTGLLDDVRRVGLRHNLTMRPTLSKPFRMEAIRRIVEEERLALGVAVVQAATALPAGDAAASTPAAISLREALDRNWLELWYQPKFALDSGNLISAEGLARVRHPELGLVGPGSFLPGASGADLIALTEYVLRLALRDAADFAYAGHSMRLAVNAPVEALFALPIPAIVRECRPRGDNWPGIILEITEDQVIRDIPAVHEIATQLRIYQIALAIDDFGLGYSSLSRLRELPFAELKLDQSFVRNCGTDATNAALCRTVVELAHRFGSIAVAEGIESRGDLAVIKATGCDVGQGFLFSHAMPKEFLLTRLMAGEAAGFAVDAGAEARRTA